MNLIGFLLCFNNNNNNNNKESPHSRGLTPKLRYPLNRLKFYCK